MDESTNLGRQCRARGHGLQATTIKNGRARPPSNNITMYRVTYYTALRNGVAAVALQSVYGSNNVITVRDTSERASGRSVGTSRFCRTNAAQRALAHRNDRCPRSRTLRRDVCTAVWFRSIITCNSYNIKWRNERKHIRLLFVECAFSAFT